MASLLKRLASAVVVLALMAVGAGVVEAATYAWKDGNSSWETAANWNPAVVPTGSTNSAQIQNGISGTSVTVQLNTVKSLSNLTIGSAYNTLNINSPGSLSTKYISLSGGSITGTGSVSANSGGLSGYGTISAPLTTSGTAGISGLTVTGGTLDLYNTATVSGNLYGATVSNDGLSVLNIDAGGTLKLNNGNATLINNGTVNLNGGTLQGATGSFSNYLKGTGPINVTANSVLQGSFYVYDDTVNDQFNIGGALGAHTLNLNTVGFAGNSGAAFNVGVNGVLNNQTGNTSIGATVKMLGGSITNTGGGSFGFSFSYPAISGYGSVSGVTALVSTVVADGGTAGTPQTLSFNGTGAGTNLGSTYGTGSAMTTTGANNTLDLQGTLNIINPFSLYPNGGTVNLDGVNITNAGGWSHTWNAGTVNVTKNSTLAGPVTSAANLTVTTGTNLNASAATFTNNGTVSVDHATATWGNFTNNGVYKSDPSTQIFNSLTVGSAGYLTGGAGDIFQIKGNFTNYSTQNTLWNTTAAELDFITGPSHNLALAGADLGATTAGFTNNFAWGTVDLTGQTLSLSDDNGSALYVEKILGVIFTGTTVTNITSDGFDVYYDPSQNPYLNGLTYNLGGEGVLAPVHAVPEPSSIALLGIGAISLIAYAWRRRRTA